MRSAEWLVARPWRLVLLVLLAVLPLLLIGELAAADTQQRVRVDRENALRSLAQRGSETVSTRTNAVLIAVTGASLIPRLEAAAGAAFRRTPESPREVSIEPNLRELSIQMATLRAALRSEVTYLFTVDGSGTVQAGDPPDGAPAPGVDVRNTEYARALDRREPRYIGPDGSSESLTVAIPLQSGGRGVSERNFLVAVLQKRLIEGWLASLSGFVGDMYVIDRQGRGLARLNGDLRPLPDTALGQPALSAATAGRNYLGYGPDPMTNVPALVAAAPIAEIGWTVIAVAKDDALQSEVDAALAQQRALRFGLSAVLILGAVLVGTASSTAIRRRREVAAALERQTAVSDVLKIISRSPIQLEAVFEGVIASAVRLCRADNGGIVRIEDGRTYVVGHAGHEHDAAAVNDYWSTQNLTADRSSLTGRVLLERRSVRIADIHSEPDYVVRDIPGQDPRPNHSVLGVPLLREGEVVGVMVLRRREVKPFTSADAALAETFASQAVIAIENVRLFNETKEALAQQTAIAGVLSTINSSRFDQGPVLDTVVERAAQLCEAQWAAISIWDGSAYVTAAAWPTDYMKLMKDERQMPTREHLIGRVALLGETVQIEDVLADPEYSYPALQKAVGYRTALGIPLLRDGVVVGVFALNRNEVRPFTPREIALVETFAQQAVIAIENVRLFNETKESLGQQTALSDVLRTISRSAFDLDAVLQTIVERAAGLVGAESSMITRRDGDDALVLAGFGPALPISGEPGTRIPVSEGTLIGRALLTGKRQYTVDATLNPDLPQGGPRTRLVIPLMREGKAIGTLGVSHNLPRPFSDREHQMLETFADQAAIAIENVRLFNETKEALKQRTATSEILRVISETLGDPQPVMQAIVDTVLAVCSADSAGFFRRSGDDLILRAVSGTWRGPRPSDVGPQLPFHGDSIVVSALEEGRYQHVADTSADPRYDAAAQWSRTRLAVPVLRGSETIGVIRVGRAEPGGFTEREIRLVEGFADQAAIAFENARLFNETKEALERQTSISDVLQTIGRSAFDLQPVLDTVVERAVKLCDARQGSISTLEDDVYRTRAYWSASSLPPAYVDFMRQEVRAPGRGSLTGRTALEGRVVHITDVLEDPEYTATDMQQAAGYRTLLGVPLLRDGRVIGVFALTRSEVRPFSDRQIELVRTFADQAAIAIENTRLFVATKEALEQQTAVGDVLKTISRSAFDLQPVLDIVLNNAVRLAGADIGWMSRVEDKQFMTVAFSNEFPQAVRDELDRQRAEGQLQGPWVPLGTGGGLMGFTLAEARTVHLPDVKEDPEFKGSIVARMTKSRTVIGVPMLRDGRSIGGMVLARYEVRPFGEREIELVQTFADQAAIAIENVRLFNETRDALERQTATSQVLDIISRAGFELGPVFDSIVGRVARLCNADAAGIWRREGTLYRLAAKYGQAPARDQIGTTLDPRAPTIQGTVAGKAVDEGRTVHVPDAASDPRLPQWGAATRLAVPIRKDGATVGVVLLVRTKAAAFTPQEIELVESFAAQAAIAIENARLFNEIQDKSRQLEVASRHKSEFLANMSHELRTPLNAIIGFSEVLVQGLFGEVNEKQREYLQDVIGSGQHLLSLINDILDLSKIEAGRMELELSTFNFRDALQSGVTIVRERAARHGITLNVDVSDEVGQVEADERKVKQILYNLLSNAVKFTPEGGNVNVTVRRDNGDVRVDVQDNGIGIAEADQARIFEEFQQVGRERSREGTGLGLTLTKRFVELHGGRIWLESAPAQGSTFTFTLPRRQGAAVRA